MIIGTSHFVSKAHAIRYYLAYESGCYTECHQSATAAVAQKLAEGEIHIGEPALKPGQKLLVIDNGTRYAIEESTNNPNCDNDKCKSATGEVRLLPAGGGSYMILCKDCYKHEIAYRKERVSHPFEFPAWEYLKVYSVE